ncbi:MAG: T3SS effector HopA1 family protein [Pseudomonadota bacterium]
MNRDLERWLNWTWDNRATIMRLARESTHSEKHTHWYGYDANRGIQEIYRYYNGSIGGQATENITAQDARNPDLNKFAANLALAKLELGTVQVDVQRNAFVHNVSVSDLQNLTPDEIAGTFFHYRRRTIPTTKRVYLNLRPEGRGEAFRRILAKIWTLHGLDTAKVSGPGAADRVDTVVIYCQDQGSQESVVGELTDFNRENRGLFRAPLPKLVRPVDGLVGIGCASEPPDVRLVRMKGKTYFQAGVSQSFGAYRSEIIFAALEGSRTKSKMPESLRKRWFKEKALKLLRAGGVDPDNPARQHRTHGGRIRFT